MRMAVSLGHSEGRSPTFQNLNRLGQNESYRYPEMLLSGNRFPRGFRRHLLADANSTGAR